MSESTAPPVADTAPAAPVAVAPAVAPASSPPPSGVLPSGQSPATPGPASDATPPVATATETVAPAASSSPPAETAPAAPATDTKPSILSSATDKAAEGEPKADAAADPDAKAPAAEAKATEPLPPPTYESFTFPEGVTVDETKVGAFTGMLGEFEAKIAADPTSAHAAIQELGQNLVNFYAAQAAEAAQKQVAAQKDAWEQTVAGWETQFRNDPDLGRNRQQTTLSRIGSLMDRYRASVTPERSEALSSALNLTGAGNNPEVLRLMHWAARQLTETSRVVTPMMPRSPVRSGSPAERLYKNSTAGVA